MSPHSVQISQPYYSTEAVVFSPKKLWYSLTVNSFFVTSGMLWLQATINYNDPRPQIIYLDFLEMS